MSYFLKQSAKIGTNMLDWLRSIYFSLLTSTLLVVLTKFYSLENLNIIVLILALICILCGLWMSVKITNRFKGYDRDFDKDPQLDKNLSSKEYLTNRDSTFATQHTLMFILWIPSLLLIAIGGLFTEQHTAAGSKTNKQLLEDIRNKELEIKNKESIYDIDRRELKNELRDKQDSIKKLKAQIRKKHS